MLSSNSTCYYVGLVLRNPARAHDACHTGVEHQWGNFVTLHHRQRITHCLTNRLSYSTPAEMQDPKWTSFWWSANRMINQICRMLSFLKSYYQLILQKKMIPLEQCRCVIGLQKKLSDRCSASHCSYSPIKIRYVQFAFSQTGQELSYRKQIARQLRTQYVESI